MRYRKSLGAFAATVSVALAAGLPAATGSAAPARSNAGTSSSIKHVLLISVDGMHQSDLAWYVHHYPQSELASLAGRGSQYTDAHTQVPSDSFPGMVGQLTGGTPAVTGVYYDDEYNHALLPPGTTNCAKGQPLGAQVIYDSPIDKDPTRLDAGQGLPNLPADILQMTGAPQSLLVRSGLPVDPTTCQPVYPNQYLKVNTVFGVVHAHGPAHRLVRQASGLLDPQRTDGQLDRRSLHPRDRQQRDRLCRRRQLDQRQPGDHAVRLLQGSSGFERDRRL